MADAALAIALANRLRRDILRGALPPGAPIKERDGAAEAGVSRTPMREAIRILAKEGLIELRPARSPIVARPSAKEISDHVTVLVALEMLSGELACEHGTEAEFDHLAELTARMGAMTAPEDDLDRFETDMAFHAAIARASGNAALAETHSAYLARLWRARFLSFRIRQNRDRALRQHEDILAALRARSKAKVRAALQAHLGHMGRDMLRMIEAE